MRLKRKDKILIKYVLIILVGSIIATNIFPTASAIILLATGLSIGYMTGLWKSGKL